MHDRPIQTSDKPNTNNFDAYCALCKVEGRNTIQMFPATDECNPSFRQIWHTVLLLFKSKTRVEWLNMNNS